MVATPQSHEALWDHTTSKTALMVWPWTDWDEASESFFWNSNHIGQCEASENLLLLRRLVRLPLLTGNRFHLLVKLRNAISRSFEALMQLGILPGKLKWSILHSKQFNSLNWDWYRLIWSSWSWLYIYPWIDCKEDRCMMQPREPPVLGTAVQGLLQRSPEAGQDWHHRVDLLLHGWLDVWWPEATKKT